MNVQRAHRDKAWPRKRGLRRREGYVLVMALLLIALAGLLLAGLARHSLTAAEESLRAETELQQRWGTLSLEQALLEQAPARFSPAAAEAENEPPRPVVRQVTEDLSLGGVDYRLLLADEDAKLNLNTVFRLAKAVGVRRAVEELSPLPPPVLVRLVEADKAVAPLSSWGQVFAYEELLPTETAARIRAATGKVSCWGPGRVNVRTAPPEVLEIICRLARVAPQNARRFIQALQADPASEIEKLLLLAKCSEQERDRLRPLLADESRTYSLWLDQTVHGQTRTSLTISQRGLGLARRHKFRW